MYTIGNDPLVEATCIFVIIAPPKQYPPTLSKTYSIQQGIHFSIEQLWFYKSLIKIIEKGPKHGISKTASG